MNDYFDYDDYFDYFPSGPKTMVFKSEDPRIRRVNPNPNPYMPYISVSYKIMHH